MIGPSGPWLDLSLYDLYMVSMALSNHRGSHPKKPINSEPLNAARRMVGSSHATRVPRVPRIDPGPGAARLPGGRSCLGLERPLRGSAASLARPGQGRPRAAEPEAGRDRPSKQWPLDPDRAAGSGRSRGRLPGIRPPGRCRPPVGPSRDEAAPRSRIGAGSPAAGRAPSRFSDGLDGVGRPTEHAGDADLAHVDRPRGGGGAVGATAAPPRRGTAPHRAPGTDPAAQLAPVRDARPTWGLPTSVAGARRR